MAPLVQPQFPVMTMERRDIQRHSIADDSSEAVGIIKRRVSM
jgi:hypothetical protein